MADIEDDRVVIELAHGERVVAANGDTSGLRCGDWVALIIRPEHIRIHEGANDGSTTTGENILSTRLEDIVYLGVDRKLVLCGPSEHRIALHERGDRLPGEGKLELGATVPILLPAARLHAFEASDVSDHGSATTVG